MKRLIDADAFKKENERLLHCDFPYLSETTFEELIDEAPTIDAEPVRHGKWECTYSPNGFLLEQTCSECGLTFEEPSGVDYNYCPQCGARMDKDERD